MRGQEDVVNALREAFARDPIISAERVRISLLGPDSLVLQGEVQTLEAKEEASALAQQIAPTCAVDNALTVSGNRLAPDATLVRQASKALVEGGLPNSLGVEVRGGVAYLLGHAETVEERRLASQAVSRVPGIRAVRVDHLILAPRGVPTDEVVNLQDERWLVNQIEEKLGADMSPARADEIDVGVEKGVVMLRGFVKTAKERAKAEALVRTVQGVKHLRNLLVAQDGSFGCNEAIEAKIRHAFGRAGDHVSPVDVKIFVCEDTAYLFGQVDRPEQIQKAVDIVRSHPEIRHVFPSLKVTPRHPPSAKGPGRAVRDMQRPED